MRFKYSADSALYDDLKKPIRLAFEDMDKWSLDNYGEDLLVTATITTPEQDLRDGRKELAHQERRALDISIHKWGKKRLEHFLIVFGDKYRAIGAKSREDNIRRFLVYKPHGTGPHIHCQIGKDIKE